MATSDERKQSFGASVDAYDRTRPDFPVAAVRWCLGDPDRPLTVCDLGAGTGKLTRVLLDLGHRVIAVEPDDRMLERLRASLGDRLALTALAGTAEDIPVDDRSVDAVIAGQSWHWFDQDAAGLELGRVLRPDGIAGALWYSLDATVEWVDRWMRLIGTDTTPIGKAVMATAEPHFGDWAGPIEEATFAHGQQIASVDLVDRAATTSPVIALDPVDRAEVFAAIDDMVTTHPDLAGGTTIVPYRIECFRARRHSRRS